MLNIFAADSMAVRLLVLTQLKSTQNTVDVPAQKQNLT